MSLWYFLKEEKVYFEKVYFKLVKFKEVMRKGIDSWYLKEVIAFVIKI